MKLGELIEYNNKNIFLQKYADNEAGRLVPDLFIFKKRLILGKSKRPAT